MKPVQGDCKEWKAWHDQQPGKAASLHVTGKCTFSTGGYTVVLTPKKPQGINPKVYLLEKVVHPPKGPATGVLTVVEVHYSEKTDVHYDSVTIQPDGVSVAVKEVT